MVLTHPQPTPFLTYYEGIDRVELSGVTFVNWVEKTTNLIDDLGIDLDEPVQLALLDTHPGHWVTLIWCAAVWLAGGSVATANDGGGLLIIGPNDARRGETTVACSLHPLGLGFSELPKDCIDYADVLAQPDHAVPAPFDDAALLVANEPNSRFAQVPPRSERRLFTEPEGTWAFLADALIAPMRGGGSSVIAIGLDNQALRHVAAEERVSNPPV